MNSIIHDLRTKIRIERNVIRKGTYLTALVKIIFYGNLNAFTEVLCLPYKLQVID